LAAEAGVVDRTARVGVLDARVQTGGGELVALAMGTFYIQTAKS
jgi:acyl-coenzyme A thioesterase PaaI-like protein